VRPSSVAAALARARERGVARLDAQLLLARLLGRERGWLIAHDEWDLLDGQQRDFDALLVRRAAGEPLAYLVGEKEFRGLMLEVGPAVLVPRPETELLVDWAIERLQASAEACPQAVDLGTGSGAIAIALKHALPAARVTALDASAAALSIARRNAARLGLDIEWLQGDWWWVLPKRRFDLVLANPPYVAEDDPHLHALRHEPRQALVAGPQGLDALRVIVAGAPAHLRPGGWLLLEHGCAQAEAVRSLLLERGFEAVETRIDLAGHPRCSGGLLKPQEACPAAASVRSNRA
jgi:release factor glutamine methyltransferase